MEKKKRIVVLGAGESGVGAAVLAQVKGFDVFVSDMSVIQDKYKEQLDRYEIPFEEGKHTPDLILNADEVVRDHIAYQSLGRNIFAAVFAALLIPFILLLRRLSRARRPFPGRR